MKADKRRLPIQVKPSRIAGKGVFAARELPKGFKVKPSALDNLNKRAHFGGLNQTRDYNAVFTKDRGIRTVERIKKGEEITLPTKLSAARIAAYLRRHPEVKDTQRGKFLRSLVFSRREAYSSSRLTA